ncbi:hypothetical protein HOU90_gp097 [Lactobacillus phage Lpa804]|uniref:Uncharacterized protein n=1 Tax=Lactobacillus phage Lpa804 TaxID=2059850 RepID=A0A3S6QAB6_9CAUD|nr:hypothetical protein HOU90_gp097 [Lactobacillus phage Lpa804]AUG84695.1 hypothetical protein Lpa804_177 [Lactobacillus phage Lpa804]
MADLTNQFKDLFTRTINQNVIERSMRDDLSKWIKTKDSSINTSNVGDNVLSLSYTLIEDEAKKQGAQFIDLKPYFARSSKAKHTKDGGWYMVIPIQRGAPELRSAYGRSLWDTISHTNYGETSSQGDVSRLQEKLGVSPSATIPELAYKWKSNNVTRVKWGSSGKRGRYVQFRTVSNKSDPNSWIVGRQTLNEETPGIEQLAPYISTIMKNHVDEYLSQTNNIL